MPYIRYEDHNFGQARLRIIHQADEICREWAAMGYDLTLRQLYYQFVSRDLIPNNQRSYDRLGDIINKARLAGLIDWNHIVDRTRNLRSLSHWNSPSDIIDSAADSYRIDKWAHQGTRVETWIEKDALAGILRDACEPLDVPYFSCRGYTSQSEVWGAAQRIRKRIEGGQKVVILHLGDHDPSGVDMTRDIKERLFLFIATDMFQGGMTRDDAIRSAKTMLKIQRIALNMDQVERFQPPPNPAKFTDARYRKYVDEYGRECWELDALPPDVLSRLIRSRITACMTDVTQWEKDVARETREKKAIRKVARRWRETVKFMTYLDKKAS